MTNSSALILLGAVVAGLAVQAWLTYRQGAAFTAAIRQLRRDGKVSVGAAGKRYRGGRAFVALACDDDGRITRAVTLSGWTTFARPTDLAALRGAKVSQLSKGRAIPDLREPQRQAVQQAAEFLQTHLKGQATAPATLS